MKQCIHCGISFTDLTMNPGSHVAWCNKNPKIAEHKHNLKNNREAITLESRATMSKSIANAHASGRYTNSPAKGLETKKKNGTLNRTAQAKENSRIAALKSKHQRKCKKSHEFIDKRGRKFTFDSTWEDALAIRLDELDIDWTRPGPVEWTDKHGIVRNYFPDFYLQKYNLYIDPKNNYVETYQKEKLDIVSTQINLIILRSMQACKEFLVRETGIEPA